MRKAGKGWENLSFRSVKRPKRLTDAFYGVKKSKIRSGFVISTYFKNSQFMAVKRDAKL